jgi:flagellar basal-body rod modification protein FlgD
MSTIYDMYAYSASGASKTSSSASTTSSTSSTNDVGESFMALLLAELKYQNPLEPMDTNQMVSQMVQLNSLTQLQNISTAIEKTNESNLFQSGTGLIGKTVGYYDDNEDLQSGVVEAFEMDGDSLLLTIGDSVIDFDSVAFVTQTSETENE